MGQGSCCCAHDDGNNVKSITADMGPGEETDKQAASADISPLDMGVVGEQNVTDITKKSDGSGSQTKRFKFTVTRNGKDNIGLNLDALDGCTAFVDDVIPGAIQNWNDTHGEEESLQVYDRIVSVNGVGKDTDRMLAELKGSLTWTLETIRPQEVLATVDCKLHPSLGLDLKYSPNGNTLLIAELGDAAVTDWNRGSQRVPINKFDRIVSINGQRGSARSLLHSASDCTVLELVILHYNEQP